MATETQQETLEWGGFWLDIGHSIILAHAGQIGGGSDGVVEAAEVVDQAAIISLGAAPYPTPGNAVDFLRGPAEMAEAIRENRPCRLSTELGVHIVELVEALQYPERYSGRKEMHTTFAPMRPSC